MINLIAKRFLFDNGLKVFETYIAVIKSVSNFKVVIN